MSDYSLYISLLKKWDNKLIKNSVEAMIYVNWERTIIKEFNNRYVPKEVQGLLRVQLYKILDKLSDFNEILGDDRYHLNLTGFLVLSSFDSRKFVKLQKN